MLGWDIHVPAHWNGGGCMDAVVGCIGVLSGELSQRFLAKVCIFLCPNLLKVGILERGVIGRRIAPVMVMFS